MKLYVVTLLALFLSQEVVYSDNSKQCPKDNYIITDTHGVKIECLPCQSCVVGYGLMPSCGKKLTSSQKSVIKCVPCKIGETFSAEHGPSSCKNCQICPVTEQNCTASSDTKCSENCGVGFYYDGLTYNCQPCSQCCKEDNKKITECKSLPVERQCSVHDALGCAPKTTTVPYIPKEDPTSDKLSKKMKIVVGVLVAVVIVGAIGITLFMIWWFKFRNQQSADHVNFVNNGVISMLDDSPEQGTVYKKFKDLTQSLYEQIADMLTPDSADIGNWRRVAEKYDMSHTKIRALESDPKRAMEVIGYIRAYRPDLTIFDFCKFMKEIKQNQIAYLLKDQLTCEDEKKRLDIRDSGFDHVSDQFEEQPMPSTSGSTNFNFTTTRLDLKLDPEKGKGSLKRQNSNQSTKSSGSGSSSLLRGAKSFARQISQTSTYKIHENDNDNKS